MVARPVRVLLLCAALAGRTAGAQTPPATITVNDARAGAGQSATLTVRTDTALLLGSTDLVLQLDSTVADAVAAESLLEDFTYRIDGERGAVATASATGGAGDSVAAGGTLFTVTVRVHADAAPGCTPVTLADGDRTLPDDLAGPMPPLPPLPILYTAVGGSLCVTEGQTSCEACEDGDRCTIDTCEAGGQCSHVERAAGETPGVGCTIENLRLILAAPPEPVCRRRCPAAVERDLARLESRLATAAAADRPPTCKKAVRALARSARAFRQRITGLARHGMFVPSDRGTRLTSEAKRLVARSRTLSHELCTRPES